MNYSDLTDFEINKLVAELRGVRIKRYLPERGGVIVEYFNCEPVCFDPCNNPNDAWPIIESIWWELLNGDYDGRSGWGKAMRSDDDSDKLRAAMIVFLKMNEGKS